MIQEPKTDPIIEEIHKVRREISERFGGDVRAIAADANARMSASGCPIWKPSDTKAIHPSGGGSVATGGDSTPAAG
jgi:hypothetical protein